MWYFVQRTIAAITLVCLMPLFALLYVLVRATSRGPFLYSQRRPGRNGKPFTIWKVRTMSVGADRDPTLARSVRNDNPQVTTIGRVLRSTKLDELPQLWNVVRGEMAFVGPRPIAITLYEELREKIPGFERRLSVRPGLTNLGQVCLDENAAADFVVEDWRLRFEAERHYLDHRCVWYDLVMIGMTVLFLGRKLGIRVGGGTRGNGEPVASLAAEPVELDLPVDGGGGDLESPGRLVGGTVA